MPKLAETYITTQHRPGYDVNLRTEPRKFLHTEGDEPLGGYVIQRGVGVGGFGEVYYATSQAGKDVALKRVHHNLDIELRGVRHCLNLRHPNLVELYDIRYDSLHRHANDRVGHDNGHVQPPANPGDRFG